MSRIRQSSDFRCTSEPSAIEAELAQTRQPYIKGNNQLTISPAVGLICRNFLEQSAQNCRDYRVRFCCQLPPRKHHSRSSSLQHPKPSQSPPPPSSSGHSLHLSPSTSNTNKNPAPPRLLQPQNSHNRPLLPQNSHNQPSPPQNVNNRQQGRPQGPRRNPSRHRG